MNVEKALRLWLEDLPLRRVLQLQPAYYLLTAPWPVLHFPSSRRVVGPKPDRFQFLTTDWLIVVIGAALAIDGRRPAPSVEMTELGAMSTAAFIGVEAHHMSALEMCFCWT